MNKWYRQLPFRWKKLCDTGILLFALTFVHFLSAWFSKQPVDLQGLDLITVIALTMWFNICFVPMKRVLTYYGYCWLFSFIVFAVYEAFKYQQFSFTLLFVSSAVFSFLALIIYNLNEQQMKKHTT